MTRPRLLAIVELGGYPNLIPLYTRLGIEAEVVGSQREARRALKRRLPDLVVAEYNYQSDFRDRSSNLESLMAILQRHPEVKLIVFHMPQHARSLARFRTRFPVFEAIPFPVTEERVAEALQRALETA